MSKKYDTQAAVDYMKEQGVTFSAGTLEVWRSQGRGPRYIKIGRKPYYPQESLDVFLAGVPVHTIDTVSS